MTLSVSARKLDRLGSDFEKAMNAVHEAIADRDTTAIAGTVAAVYAYFLNRIVSLSRRFDEARDGEHQRSKELIRAARLVLRDEQSFLDFADEALRGLCHSLGMKSQIEFERGAKSHRNAEDAGSDELADLRLNYLFFKIVMKNLVSTDCP